MAGVLDLTGELLLVPQTDTSVFATLDAVKIILEAV